MQRLTLKQLHENYIAYKEELQTETMKRKREVIEDLYYEYAADYKDQYYLNDLMMRAIDDGETQINVFYEEEDAEISLWDNDLVGLFTKDLDERHPSLESLLSKQLSDEFSLVTEKHKLQDYRDGSMFNALEVSVSWENPHAKKKRRTVK